MTPFYARLIQLADDDPDRPALLIDEDRITRAELLELAERWGRNLVDRGVQPDDLVGVQLQAAHRFWPAVLGTWLAGATPMPLSPRMPQRELHEVLQVARPRCVLTSRDALRPSTAALPQHVAASWKAPTSGGSTGVPKVILAGQPAAAEVVDGFAQLLDVRPGETHLATAPLHHNGPFLTSALALLTGGAVVAPAHFDPERWLRLVEQHRVSWSYLVPTTMRRIWALGHDGPPAADLSSLRMVLHMAAPCPAWLKHNWISWLGGDRVREVYAGTEAQAATLVTGGEWLRHPGTVGRAVLGQIEVRREDGSTAAAHEVGEVWLRPSPSAGPTYRYLGAEARRAPGGWESLGDMGWLDEEGYLYLADRRSDMVTVGGSNVYPAEVEAALEEHPAVLSSCVIGLPDEDLGNRLHALVQLAAELPDDQLRAHVRDRLSPYKVPRTWERVEGPLRDDAGKVRRSQFRSERLVPAP